jgi:hypothetical protein
MGYLMGMEVTMIAVYECISTVFTGTEFQTRKLYTTDPRTAPKEKWTPYTGPLVWLDESMGDPLENGTCGWGVPGSERILFTEDNPEMFQHTEHVSSLLTRLIQGTSIANEIIENSASDAAARAKAHSFLDERAPQLRAEVAAYRVELQPTNHIPENEEQNDGEITGTHREG